MCSCCSLINSLYLPGAQQKLDEDGQQLTGCTFAPKTGRPPKEDTAPKQPFPDRLYRRRDGKYAQVCWVGSSFVQTLNDC